MNIRPPLGFREDMTSVGNGTTAADWMSDNSEVVIGIIGRSRKETETFVNGMDLTDCNLKCREDDNSLTTFRVGLSFSQLTSHILWTVYSN